ncbi:hypothetical protein CJD36_004195 [Flavipsychrobacter stenotrophus]|uniref:Secretion system C-terminal sorting domain-containing protein n=1 Tax=Flavipsychrobacter stenotrophus TaxID=2077091 RepID=A0A2S7T171_9BACT|nr:T9SS type A sorting domain-containing protein [Flavipsychrobacter stenotrophus]PQJ12952.1 hypothetical protein CJD36_004195 [Flavipsychrobacter stenotrophus]
MKKVVLSAAITIASIAAATAQPTLIAATNTPLAGDVNVAHYLDSNSIAVGASGATVTWNFGSVVDTTTDTTRFLSCAATPYCDSFSGANLASFDGSDYTYIVTSAAKITAIGGHSGSDFIHFTDPKDFIRFPFTYNNSWVDTSSVPFSGASVNYVDSNTADAYGTLVLPSGTYPNALRMHTVTHQTVIFSGFPVSSSRTESYSWYAQGIRTPLMIIDLDTSGTGVLHLDQARYYTHSGSTTAVNDAKPVASGLNIFPNPAANLLHIAFNLANTADACVTISDLTGRTIANIAGNSLVKGANELSYSVSELPAGVYIVQLYSAEGNATQKFVVGK